MTVLFERFRKWKRDLSFYKVFKHIEDYHKIQELKHSTTTLEIITIEGKQYISYDGTVVNNLHIKGNIHCGTPTGGLVEVNGDLSVSGILSMGRLEKVDGEWVHPKWDFDNSEVDLSVWTGSITLTLPQGDDEE